MNSLNLRQVCGGDTIKQADFGSELAFELLDEQYVKFRESLGESAKVILKKDNTAIYQKSVPITQNTVSFNFDKILPVGSYVLEIIVGNYVFPSNNRVIITIEQTYGDFEPEYLVKVSYEELKADVDDVKTKIEQFENTLNANETNVNQELLTIGKNQAEMTKRIETLEQKQDNDTIYDDSELVSRVTALENKPDKDTIYNDAQLKEEISKTKSKVDSLSEKVSSLESKKDNDTIYDDSEIKRRITALEQKEDHDTIYDDTEIKQSIANVDTKVDNLSEKVTALEERPIVDTALTKRVEALEDKPDNDTIYDDTNLKAQVAELQEKLKSLNTVRRAPTGYTLDRTTTPWTIWFDNGCGLQMSEYGTAATVYGYGFSASYIDNNIVTFPIIPNIMRVSNGSLTIEKIKTLKGYADFWSPSIKIINPIRDRDDYDWANARFNPESLSNNHYSFVRQQYFIRTMYELGIWSKSDVEGFGAVKK